MGRLAVEFDLDPDAPAGLPKIPSGIRALAPVPCQLARHWRSDSHPAPGYWRSRCSRIRHTAARWAAFQPASDQAANSSPA
jgi:hypothetical protein